MRKHLDYRWFVVPLLCLVFAFTSWYGIGYLLAVIFAARKVRFSRIFKTYVGNFVVTLLLLGIAIMLAGTISWIVKAHTSPVLVLVLFGLAYATIYRLHPDKNEPPAFIDLGDVVSLVLAVAAVAIIALSYFTPHATAADAIQFFTNGYDNNAHYSLMRATANDKGFVYYSPGSGKPSIYNAYPQGWHFASANIADGFGTNLFDYKVPLRGLYTYLTASALWYIIMVYAFTLVGWRLFRNTASAAKKVSFDHFLVFAAGNLLLQLVLFWGTYTFGFASYIGCIVYLILLAAMIIEYGERKSLAYFITAALSLIAVAETWLLPVPAVIVTIALGFYKKQSLKEAVTRLFRDKRLWAPAIVAVIALASSLFQVWIILNYAGSVTTQIVTDGGVFGISNLLVAVILAGGYAYWMTQRGKASRQFGDAYMAIVIPILVLSLAIYAFEILSSGSASYYFVKTFGLVLCLGGLFFMPAFCDVVIRYTKDSQLPFRGAILAAGVIAVLIVGSGQTTFAFDGLLQRGSRIGYKTSTVIAHYLASGKESNESLLVLRGYRFTEDNNGTYFASGAAFNGQTCLDAVTGDSTTTIKARITRLNHCAASSTQPILVVTSDRSQNAVTALHQSDITTIFVHK